MNKPEPIDTTNKPKLIDTITGYGCMTIFWGVIGVLLWGGWNNWGPFRDVVGGWKEWAAPKPFASVNKDFKVESQFRTLTECERKVAEDARLFGSNFGEFIAKGCVNLAENPQRLVFEFVPPPAGPSDWHLTFTHPGSDPDNPNTDIVGHYPTLRDCLLAAIPLMPSDKKSMREAGFDCEYGPAQEKKP